MSVFLIRAASIADDRFRAASVSLFPWPFFRRATNTNETIDRLELNRAV